MPATARHYLRAADVLETETCWGEALGARNRAGVRAGVRRLLAEHGRQISQAPVADWAEALPAAVQEDEPWVTVGQARCLLEDGRLAEADLTARRAGRLHDEPDACGEVARAVRTWFGDAVEPTARWDDALRAATRRHPASVAHVAGRMPDPLGPVVSAAALFLAGDQRQADRLLRSCLARAVPRTLPALVARLALVALQVLVDPNPRRCAQLQALDKVHVDAGSARAGLAGPSGQRSRGRPHRSAGLGRAPCRGRRPARRQLGGRPVRRGRGGLTAGRRAAGHFNLRGARRRCRSLDAGVREAWMRALQSLAAAMSGLPDAGEDARAAEAVARAAGVPGAVTVAYAALALADPDQGARSSEFGATGGVHRRCGRAGQSTVELEAAGRAGRRQHGPEGGSGAGGRANWVRSRHGPGAQVKVLGGFRITVDGAVPDLARVRPRARMALRMLALHAGRPVHREQLLEALWNDLDPSAGMHNLQVAVSSLRAALEPRAPGRASRLLVRDGEAYVLDLDRDGASDLMAFDDALAVGARARDVSGEGAAVALTRALGLYVGDVLPEDGPASWVADVREGCRLRAAEAAVTLAEIEFGRGRPREAALASARSLQLDRWRDSAWRLLIAAYDASGDVAAAARARNRYRDVLQSLDVPAAHGLTAARPAMATIIRGPGTPPRPAPAACWPARPGTTGR